MLAVRIDRHSPIATATDRSARSVLDL